MWATQKLTNMFEVNSPSPTKFLALIKGFLKRKKKIKNNGLILWDRIETWVGNGCHLVNVNG